MSFYTAIRRFCLARPSLNAANIRDFFSQQILSLLINIEWPLSIDYIRDINISFESFEEEKLYNMDLIQCYSFDDLHDALAELSTYFFRVNLGNLHSWIANRLSAPPAAGNRMGFAIDSATIECHPIIHQDDEGEPFKLGNFALSLHGPGYLFPLTKQDLLMTLANISPVVNFIQYFEFYFEPPLFLIDDAVANIFEQYCDDKEYRTVPQKRYFWHISQSF